MKPIARGPPEKRNTPKWQKRTPSTDDSVLPRWQARYAELRELEYSKWGALYKMGEEYSLHPNTLETHLFPHVKEKRKKYQRERWQKKQADAENRGSPDYKHRYQNLRNHIKDHVEQAFSESNLEALTLEQISDSIRRKTDISLAPSTIQNLAARLNSKIGYELLSKVPGEDDLYGLGSPSNNS